MNGKPKAIILLSGGIDSTATIAIAKNLGFEVYALSFHYGQRHKMELDAAQRNAKNFRVARHMIIDIDPIRYGLACSYPEEPSPQFY